MAQYSDRNLIVNYLPQEFPDQEFFKLFATVGTVKRAKIVRDRLTGFSYGFGFVEYMNAEDAQRAILHFNGLQLEHKVLKVAFARLQGDETKNCNLHLEGLPRWVTPDELGVTLAQFGGIINCKILLDDNGKSRNQGFALFETRTAAETALNALNGQSWPNTSEPPLVVRFAAENSKKVRAPNIGKASRQPMLHYSRLNPQQAATLARGFTLYIYNIGKQTSDNELYSLFVQFGSIMEALVLRDRNRGISKNCGFVTYANYQSAMTAIQALNGMQYKGRTLQVSFKKAARHDVSTVPNPVPHFGAPHAIPGHIYGAPITHI